MIRIEVDLSLVRPCSVSGFCALTFEKASLYFGFTIGTGTGKALRSLRTRARGLQQQHVISRFVVYGQGSSIDDHQRLDSISGLHSRNHRQ